MGHGTQTVLNTANNVFALNIENIFQLTQTPIHDGLVGRQIAGLNNIFFVFDENLSQWAGVFTEAEVVLKIVAQPAIYALFHTAAKQPAIAFISTGAAILDVVQKVKLGLLKNLLVKLSASALKHFKFVDHRGIIRPFARSLQLFF